LPRAASLPRQRLKRQAALSYSAHPGDVLPGVFVRLAAGSSSVRGRGAFHQLVPLGQVADDEMLLW
jgi:hypothetical protein